RNSLEEQPAAGSGFAVEETAGCGTGQSTHPDPPGRFVSGNGPVEGSRGGVYLGGATRARAWRSGGMREAGGQGDQARSAQSGGADRQGARALDARESGSGRGAA